MILASASPRRLQLLSQIGLVPQRVITPDVDERPRPRELPRDLAMRLALAKAEAVGAQPAFVVACDTVVAVGRRVLPKAETREQARACLELMSGRRHHVYSACVVVSPEARRVSRVSETSVVFARLTKTRIEAYLDSGEWEGKAGGYAIQGRAAAFVRLLSGSYSGVVGLPLHEVANLLQGLGFRLP